MTKRNNITSRQMALLTFVTQTGLGVIMLPSILARDVGHDGWISVLAAGLIAIALNMLLVLLLIRYSDKDIFDISSLIFGRVIGTAINALLVLYLIMAAVRGVRIFTIFLRLTVLPLSPPIAVAAFVMLPSIYMVRQGLKYVVRFKYVSAVSYFIAISLITLMINDLRFSFLLPVGEAALDKIILSLPNAFAAFIGLEIIAFVFTEITDKEKAFKWQLIANSISLVFYLLIVFATTALFGENLLKIQVIPLFNLARSYNAPIFERVDLYMIALWFVVMGCSMRAYMSTAYYSLQKVFKVKNTRKTLVVFFIVLVAISRMPKDINEALVFRSITDYFGMGVTVFLILCLCISFVYRKGVKPNEKI